MTLAKSAINIAIGKPAFQSSDYGGSDPRRAVSGEFSGSLAFSTKLEQNPWWLVDLEAITPIERIVVWNRNDTGVPGADRARPLRIELSHDGVSWRTLAFIDFPFGGTSFGKPLTIEPASVILARFIRLTVEAETYLHLEQVEIFLRRPELRFGELRDFRLESDRLTATLFSLHDSGFFSSCTTTLDSLIQCHAHAIHVDRIDCSRLFSVYQDVGVPRDIWNEVFEQDHLAVLPKYSDLRHPEQVFTAFFNHFHYRDLQLAKIVPFVRRYCRPSAAVRAIQSGLKERYQIDPAKLVTLCYRGTDKAQEITPTDITAYIAVAERLLREDARLRVLIQTDQKQIRDHVAAHFGERCLFFSEMPVTAGDDAVHNTDLPGAHKIGRFSFAQTLVAVVEMLSRSRYLITHTGNVGLWLALWRGSTSGLFQFDPSCELVAPKEMEAVMRMTAELPAPAGQEGSDGRLAPTEGGPGHDALDDEERRVRECVERIRSAPLDLLRSAAWLEHELLPNLGLSGVMPDIYPARLRPHCGQGIQSFQMPNQFAPYLAHLITRGIESYAEIGVWQGGTFIVTVEVLSRFAPLKRALAVDLVLQPQMRAYAAINPAVFFFEGDSRSAAARLVLQAEPWDLVLIDGDHSEAVCLGDYTTVHGHARLIAFHDTDNAIVPDVSKIWRRITRQTSVCATEFHAQYTGDDAGVVMPVMGIGLLEFDDASDGMDKLPEIVETIPGELFGISAAAKRCMDEARTLPVLEPMPIFDLVGMSGRRYRYFINRLIGSLPDPRYLEVGVWAGSTFCSAISGNAVTAVAVDNWSQFGGPKDVFLGNLEQFRDPRSAVRFVESDFRTVDYASLGRFNVYCFDGPHRAKDQCDALILALPALDDEFLFIVDDWNWPEVRDGTMQAIQETGCAIVYSLTIRTTLDDTHPPHSGEEAKDTDWHNGYFIAVLRRPQQIFEAVASVAPVVADAVFTQPLVPSLVWPTAPAVASVSDVSVGGNPADSSLLVCISFHYVPHRLVYLLDVIRALADFPVRQLDLVILTNTTDQAEKALIEELVGPFMSGRKSLRLQSVTGLAHPFELTWAHKPIIRERFLAPGSSYTHFVYLEDDIRFGYANFCFFYRHRPLLAAHGFVPSFLRVELQDSTRTLNSSDIGHQWGISDRPQLDIGDRAFIVPDNPYCAMFVLDDELAREYVASPSFQLGASERIMEGWGVRERAAAGLCWENTPAGARFRYVIPVRRRPLSIPAECWIGHLAATYANDPGSYIGKVPVTRMVLH